MEGDLFNQFTKRRNIFHISHKNVCPALPSPVDDADKVIGDFTLHQFLLLLGAVGGGLAILISSALFYLHAFNLRNAPEQIKIMRIITIIPVYAILSLANVAVGQASVYIDPWMDVYEAICISSFYLLLHVFIAPTLEEQAAFFARLPYKRSPKAPIKGPDSLRFWRRTQLVTFQAIPVQTALAILTALTNAAGIYCINSNAPKYAHIWITILRTVCTSLSVFAVIRMTYRLKSELPGRRITTQLWSFKLIVAVESTQSAVFSFVAGEFHPSSKVSYNDVSVGLPNALLNLELVFFAIFFFKAYSYTSYTAGAAGTVLPDGTRQQRPVMGPLRATLKAISPIEVFVALFQIFTGKWKVQQGFKGPNNELQLLNQGPGRDDADPYHNHQHQYSESYIKPFNTQGPPPPPPQQQQQQWPGQGEQWHTSGDNAPWDHEARESLTAYDPHHGDDRPPTYMSNNRY